MEVGVGAKVVVLWLHFEVNESAGALLVSLLEPFERFFLLAEQRTKGLAESIGRGRYSLTLHTGLLHAYAPPHMRSWKTQDDHPCIRIRKTRRPDDEFT